MPKHLSTRGGGGPERGVEAADEFVARTVVLLCKGCPPGELGTAAHDAEGAGALGSLEEIEGKRPLTDEEIARRRAFAMLLRGGG